MGHAQTHSPTPEDQLRGGPPAPRRPEPDGLWHIYHLVLLLASRFYRALYDAALNPDLPFSAKQALLLNVLFKAMKADKDVGRLKAFAKRLMQACASAPPSFTCGCLLLLSEVTKAVPALQAMEAFALGQ